MLEGVRNYISNFLKKIEAAEAVDISLGRQKFKDVNAKAQLIAREKNWYEFDQEAQKVKLDTHLVQYEFLKKLVWRVYFLHTQENWQTENKDVPWMRFAAIKIDDETGEVLFADFIKSQIVSL